MRTLTLIVAAGLVAGCGKRETDVKGETYTVAVTDGGGNVVGKSYATPIAVTADELWSAYGGNTISADSKFTGKYVKVSGSVCEIGKASDGKYQFGILPQQARVKGPYVASVTFTIRSGEESKFAKVEANQGLEVIAKVVGRQSSSRASEGYIIALEDAQYVRHGLVR